MNTILRSHKLNHELSPDEIKIVSGGHEQEESFWYQLGAFFAQQANINDSVYATYGNTNMNHYY